MSVLLTFSCSVDHCGRCVRRSSRCSTPKPFRRASPLRLQALREGRAVVLQDDDDRENEADLIVSAERLTVETMALADPRMQRHRVPVPA